MTGSGDPGADVDDVLPWWDRVRAELGSYLGYEGGSGV